MLSPYLQYSLANVLKHSLEEEKVATEVEVRPHTKHIFSHM